MAHEAEHAVDLETGAIVGVTVQDADDGDTETSIETLIDAAEKVEGAASAQVCAPAKLDSADEPPPLLHLEMAALYRWKVTDLAKALEHPDTRTEAAEAIRGLGDAIVLTPRQAPWMPTSFVAVGPPAREVRLTRPPERATRRRKPDPTAAGPAGFRSN